MKAESILLVDDDEATNFINQLLIKRLGVVDELHIAQNGKEAIEFIKNFSLSNTETAGAFPRLILLDINMPVMDGFSFLQAYNLLDFPGKESVVIAVLTTSLNPRDAEKVKAWGVSDFLNKPLTQHVIQQLWAKHFN